MDCSKEAKNKLGSTYFCLMYLVRLELTNVQSYI